MSLLGLSAEPLRAELAAVAPDRGTTVTLPGNGLKLEIVTFSDTAIQAEVTGGKPGPYDVAVEPEKSPG